MADFDAHFTRFARPGPAAANHETSLRRLTGAFTSKHVSTAVWTPTAADEIGGVVGVSFDASSPSGRGTFVEHTPIAFTVTPS